MKKIAVLVLALMLSCLFAVCALADDAITITSVRTNYDGTVTITWDNPNGGALTVGSLVAENEDAGNQISVEFDVYGSSYTYTNLAPGVDYMLLVFPGVDVSSAAIQTVTVPEPGNFDDFRFTIKDVNLCYFVPKGNDYTYNYAKDLSNDKIYDMLDEKQFLVRIDFRHANLSQTQTLPVLTVVTSPTGHVVTDYDYVDITAGYIGFWRTMVYMNDALSRMHDLHGEIPTGKYSVKVYLDGGYVGESSFTIKN